MKLFLNFLVLLLAKGQTVATETETETETVEEDDEDEFVHCKDEPCEFCCYYGECLERDEWERNDLEDWFIAIPIIIALIGCLFISARCWSSCKRNVESILLRCRK